MVFGGLLGSTFNFVFEKQMERLQDGDRLYYLSRTAGLHFQTQLEQNTFAELVMRNTSLKHLPSDIFSRPTFVFECGNVGGSELILGGDGDDIMVSDTGVERHEGIARLRLGHVQVVSAAGRRRPELHRAPPADPRQLQRPLRSRRGALGVEIQ